ncbi:hypothetical protein QJU89_06745 [Pasteurella skyensis]|uniref:Uncharacterized protein n=1 Tax=Phocoenobacter skyensis TaxID=97481 RepID=A0AAJ6P0H7_9PAST|nr:hypothetical protein [Pasteurella skyensis]MDP8162190.1 hypothetical protein [Pasteurella skyensis]MDP8172654.1 hypothetical protein [Pasteurella skyensis]MDP8176816.1 hypothetical protein [Pasteurella skyensis]MDP8179154.1 hypothetical protein [Pasteurella skyensis]MDP8183391.1 hypothetical protein [Pasteurella skyensis]
MKYRFKVEATANNGNKIILGSHPSYTLAKKRLNEAVEQGLYQAIRVIDLEQKKALLSVERE